MSERNKLRLATALSNHYREPIHWGAFVVMVIGLGLFIWAMEVT